MDWFRRFFNKLRLLFGRNAYDSGLAEEMAFHQDQAQQAFVAAGMTPDEARHAARRQFGNATRLKEQSHETVRFWFEGVVQDFLFAIRQLRKNPGFACTAILMLALGIGASVAIFAFVDAALIRPLPYANPNRLVAVTESAAQFSRSNLSYLDYLDWKRMNKVFRSLDVWMPVGGMLNTPSGTVLVRDVRVSDGFFHTLGVSPMLGRDFYRGEDLPSAPNTMILSYTTWQRRFEGRKNVIGQKVRLSDIPYTIVGVLPRSFQFAPQGDAEFWTPLHDTGECAERRSCERLDGVARLKDGVTVETALADMTSIAQQLERQYPDTNRGQGASVMPLSEVIVGDVRPILLLLLGGSGLLLLIACVNVANLLLVRTESRQREIAVRGALGASPARLIRQFITEGLLLVAVGCAVGLAVADGAIHILQRLIPVDMMSRLPFLSDLGLNPHMLAFAAAVALVAAMLFSLTPMVRLPFGAVRAGLAEGGRSASGSLWRNLGSNMVVLELAVAVVLLAGAGLLGKSLYRLLRVDVGFQPDHLATLQVLLPQAGYEQDTQKVAVERRILDRISPLPGVKSYAITSTLPVTSNGNTDWIRFEGRPYNGEHINVPERDVTPEYFATLQAQLLRGRFFTMEDDATKPNVVIINRALARKYFPGEDPIGKRMGDISLTPDSMKEIVGVVDNIREGALDQEIVPTVYYPFAQRTDPFFNIIVRTSQDPQGILVMMNTSVHQVDPGIGTFGLITFDERIHDSVTAYLHRSAAWLVGGFAMLALLLSVVGLYGVIAYSVRQRTREIGVRMALGAQRSSIYQLILKQAGRLIGFGIAAGLVGAVGAGILMRKLLFGTQAWDISTLAMVAVVLAVAALVASYIPARSAASVNPVEALRAE
ncbi:MAG: ADOP family duplicated permease [Acidobacteriaceae bacterium]